jgi:lipopolysaccharide/colanic/teichoic acid biosynthesis glycosyltransferase
MMFAFTGKETNQILPKQRVQDRTNRNANKKNEPIVNAYLYSKQKRLLDILFSLLVIPVVVPVILVCAFLVLITMGWPVFFAQKRIGLKGKVFVIYKLRSLKKTSNNYEGILHSNDDVTPIGKILRLFRFDELPQIWNILKGQMSWVGPRPEVPYYVEMYSKLNPAFNERHLALPGITGLAQLNNPNATPNDNLDKLSHDMEYVRTARLKTDIHILFQSFFLLWK